MRLRLLTCLALVAAVSLVTVSPAVAEEPNAGNDPATAQYGDELTNITSRTEGGGGDGGGPSGVLQKRVVSPLPFTGLDLISLSAVAVALLGTGLVVRKMGASRHARS